MIKVLFVCHDNICYWTSTNIAVQMNNIFIMFLYLLKFLYFYTIKVFYNFDFLCVFIK